jgi:hypothetical protein
MKSEKIPLENGSKTADKVDYRIEILKRLY